MITHVCLLFLLSLISFHCEVKNNQSEENKSQLQVKKAYFASGCFWCVESIYESVKGVQEVISGYAGGHTQNPTYESSNTGQTGHAETVMVLYNEKEIGFDDLVRVYFGSQNITQKMGQGPDKGSQYRSLVFYNTEEEKRIIQEIKSKIEQEMGVTAAAEIKKITTFWKAENYHQDYKKNHPNHPYIVRISEPRLKSFKEKFPDLLKPNAKP